MCYFKIHLRRNLQARMASMTNSSELTKQIPDLMQTEQKEGRLVPAFFGYEAKWLRRQNRARGGRVGRVVGQAPPRARVESASGGPWRASCVSAVLQNTFYQVQRPGRSGGVRRPKVTTHAGLADTSLRRTAPPSGRRQTGPQARQSTRFTDAAGGARGSARPTTGDLGPACPATGFRNQSPEPAGPPGPAPCGTFSWMTEMYHGTRFLRRLCARTGLLATGLHVWSSLFSRRYWNSQALLLKGRRCSAEGRGRSGPAWAPGGSFHATATPRDPRQGPFAAQLGSSAAPSPAAAARPVPGPACAGEMEGGVKHPAGCPEPGSQDEGVSPVHSWPQTHSRGLLAFRQRGHLGVAASWISESECICRDSAHRSLHSRGTHPRAPPTPCKGHGARQAGRGGAFHGAGALGRAGVRPPAGTDARGLGAKERTPVPGTACAHRPPAHLSPSGRRARPRSSSRPRSQRTRPGAE